MKSFFEFIRDADASLELKLSLPIDDKGMETFLRQDMHIGEVEVSTRESLRRLLTE